MSCGGRLGAIQTHGTCWFYSILNGFILSEDGQKILFEKLNEFYKKLKGAEKAYFDDGLNAPCPLKDIAKTKQIYFWKFIDQFLCALGGPRSASLKGGRSAEMLQGISLVGTITKKEGGITGAHPQLEIGKILSHLGFKEDKDFVVVPYTASVVWKKLAVDRRRKPKFIIVKEADREYMDVNSLPHMFRSDPDYELMCSSIVIGNTKASNNQQHKFHAIAGFTCGGKGYIYDSNQRKIFDCDYWSWHWLELVTAEKVALAYDFFRNGKINYWGFGYHIFARKDYVKTIAPSCRLRYRTKTPNMNYTSPSLGRRIKEGFYSHFTEAERVAVKRRWARTEHRVPVYINQAAYNSIVNSAKGYLEGLRAVKNLEAAGYKTTNSQYGNFKKKLRNKFPAKREIPRAKTPSPEKPKSASPRTKRANQVRVNFNKYWTSLTAENRKVVRNYLTSAKSPGPLNAAKQNVNALKTAKARKEYLRKRAVNLSQNNWTALGRYISVKNLDAREARARLKK